MIKSNIRKDDNVVVISGSDKGKRGKVLFVDSGKGKVVVEGINKKKKFVRASQENPKGGVISLEFPIHISNVANFCEKCKKGVRVGMQQKDDGKSRVCRVCGKSLN